MEQEIQPTEQTYSLIPGYTTSKTIGQIGPVFIKILNDIENPEKNKTNKHLNTEYADLEAVLKVIKAATRGKEIGFTQSVNVVEKKVRVVSTLLHTSMEFVSQLFEMDIQKMDPQGIGTGSSYVRRYAAKPFFGLADTDDDGETTSNPDSDGDITLKKQPQAQGQITQKPPVNSLPRSVQNQTKPPIPEAKPNVQSVDVKTNPGEMSVDDKKKAWVEDQKTWLSDKLGVEQKEANGCMGRFLLGFFNETDVNKLAGYTVDQKIEAIKCILRCLNEATSKEELDARIVGMKTNAKVMGKAAKDGLDAESAEISQASVA